MRAGYRSYLLIKIRGDGRPVAFRNRPAATARCDCRRGRPLIQGDGPLDSVYLLLPDAAGGAVEGVVVLLLPDVPDCAGRPRATGSFGSMRGLRRFSYVIGLPPSWLSCRTSAGWQGSGQLWKAGRGTGGPRRKRAPPEPHQGAALWVPSQLTGGSSKRVDDSALLALD